MRPIERLKTIWAPCLLLSVAAPAASQEAPRLKPGTFKQMWTPLGIEIVIDGEQHPEAIPDDAAWGAVFSSLRTAKSDEASLRVLRRQLKGMPERDLQTLLDEGPARKQRDEECYRQLRERQARMLAEGTEAAIVYKKGVEMIIACRQELRDAADRLMTALTPQGQAILADYLQYKRTTLTISFPAAEVEDLYRRPR